MRPLRTADLIREFGLGADEWLTPAERREIAERRAAAMTPAQRAAIGDENLMRMSRAETRLTANDIAVDGPAANLATRKNRGH